MTDPWIPFPNGIIHDEDEDLKTKTLQRTILLVLCDDVVAVFVVVIDDVCTWMEMGCCLKMFRLERQR